MSERDSYPHGVPCWVDAAGPDPDGAMRFYRGVFGWEFEGPGEMPGEPPGRYYVARVRDRDVAGVSSEPPGLPAPAPDWNTYVRVTSADDSAAAVEAAGGAVEVPPFDADPAGRMAVVADPAGVRLCLWEAGVREGAELVNEPGAWSMSSLRTSDPEGVRSFYGDVFGWQAEAFGPPEAGVWMWRRPGYLGGEPDQPVPRDVVAMLFRADDPAPNWRPDFWIADVDAAAEKAAGLGGSVVEPPADVPGIPFRSALLADGNGARFSLSQLVLDEGSNR